MKFLQIAITLAVAATLAACGGQAGADAPMQLASVTVSTSTSVEPTPASTSAAPLTHTPAANMPAPDCAAEGCASLRIIDGNAEAWRIDAQRRAAEHAKL